MTARTPLIDERRRQAYERAVALRRPSARLEHSHVLAPQGPPPAAFYVIAIVVAVFTMLGLVMVLSASSVRLLHAGTSPWKIFNRQVMWAVLGAGALWFCARVPYTFWRRFVTPIFFSCCLAMVLPFVPGLGLTVNGARAWIALGPMTVQPSEFLKIAVLLYTAALLTSREHEMHDLRRTMYPTVLVAMLAAGLCTLQGLSLIHI